MVVVKASYIELHICISPSLRATGSANLMEGPVSIMHETDDVLHGGADGTAR